MQVLVDVHARQFEGHAKQDGCPASKYFRSHVHCWPESDLFDVGLQDKQIEGVAESHVLHAYAQPHKITHHCVSVKNENTIVLRVCLTCGCCDEVSFGGRNKFVCANKQGEYQEDVSSQHRIIYLACTIVTNSKNLSMFLKKKKEKKKKKIN